MLKIKLTFTCIIPKVNFKFVLHFKTSYFMKTNFTAAYMLGNRGCYEKQQIADLVGENKEISIEDFLNWDIPLKDKAWFIRNKCELTTDQLREFAIGAALCVLPIYETKHPDNKAPRRAIEAAQAYLRKEIGIDVLIEARKEARAAYAADAAYAAADAAAKGGEVPVSYKDLLLLFFKEFMSQTEALTNGE